MRLLFSGTQSVYHFFSLFFFNERGKPRCAARLGLARRAVESSAKHRFSIWQRAEKRKERLLSSSTPASYFSPPVSHDDPLVRSFLLVHRFERHSAVTWLYSLARGKGFLHLLPSTILPIPACPVACDRYFVFPSLFFLAQPRICIRLEYEM